MGRFWCDYPYDDDDTVSVFYCKVCRNRKQKIQFAHIRNIIYWEVKGPVTSGVLFSDVKHVEIDKDPKKGFFYKSDNVVMFDPYVVGLHSTEFSDVSCKFCKTHVGYHIPALDAIIMFYMVLI